MHAFRRFSLALALVSLFPAIGAVAEDLHPSRTLVELDSMWRYHDGDEDLGKAWREPDFNDENWKKGRALLGYHTGKRSWPAPGLETELTPGLGTYYFRHSFDYDGPLDHLRLQLDQIVDDAAVYYLNGIEVGRSALAPEGDVSFSTRSTAVTNPALEVNAFAIDPTSLRQGRNVLAASVHNQSTTSSDIAFRARLTVEDARKPKPPVGLLLTWQRDPTTTMTIDWHRRADELDQPAIIEARPRGTDAWRPFEALRLDFPNSDRKVDRVELTGLEPGSEYEFRGGPGSPTYWFRTAPAKLERPLTFAVGGDTRHRKEWLEEMNRTAMEYDPEFIVWGGDLAYADGVLENVHRWYEWFDGNMHTLIADNGRVPPIVAAIGNHEVLGGSHQDRMKTHADREKYAPFFYRLFAFPGEPGYGVLDFGDYLSLVIGDTDHSNTIVGEQTDWMKRTLEARRNVSHVLPVYHVPAFPSHRKYDKGNSRDVREHWVPLFEANGVQVAFEHDDHAFKRTVPIRKGKEDPNGIVYLGDGCWGVEPRPVHDPATTWYLEKAGSVRHGILVTLTPDGKAIRVIDHAGREIDKLDIPVRK